MIVIVIIIVSYDYDNNNDDNVLSQLSLNKAILLVQQVHPRLLQHKQVHKTKPRFLDHHHHQNQPTTTITVFTIVIIIILWKIRHDHHLWLDNDRSCAFCVCELLNERSSLYRLGLFLTILCIMLFIDGRLFFF